MAVVEAMKMEHVITAPHGGIVRGVTMAPGDVVREGYPIVFIQEAEVAGGAVAAVAGPDPDHSATTCARATTATASGWTSTGRTRSPGAGSFSSPHGAREHRPPRRPRVLQVPREVTTAVDSRTVLIEMARQAR